MPALISERTKAALAARKARGLGLGNPNPDIASYASAGAKASLPARQRNVLKRLADRKLIVAGIQAEGHTSLRQIASALNERGIDAPRGGKWHPGTVRRVLQSGE